MGADQDSYSGPSNNTDNNCTSNKNQASNGNDPMALPPKVAFLYE